MPPGVTGIRKTQTGAAATEGREIPSGAPPFFSSRQFGLCESGPSESLRRLAVLGDPSTVLRFCKPLIYGGWKLVIGEHCPWSSPLPRSNIECPVGAPRPIPWIRGIRLFKNGTHGRAAAAASGFRRSHPLWPGFPAPGPGPRRRNSRTPRFVSGPAGRNARPASTVFSWVFPRAGPIRSIGHASCLQPVHQPAVCLQGRGGLLCARRPERNRYTGAGGAKRWKGSLRA